MQLSINQLQSDIEDKFKNENGRIYFGIDSTEYIYKFNRLIVKIGHYKNNNSVYELKFNEVELCRIGEESHNHEFKEEIFEGFSFFWKIKNSVFKEDFNSWSTYDKIRGLEQFNKLKSYRIIAQNNFIDILTTEEPIIELVEKEST